MPEDQVMDWNDTVENDGQEFTVLPAGEYPFRVTKFERARYNPGPSSKLPACNQAKLTLDVGDAEKSTTIICNLFLVKSQEWKLASFFRSIGARKHGERMIMDWSKVAGATGVCKVKIRKWKGKEGQDMESNEVDKFLDPPEGQAARNEAATTDVGW